MAATSQGWPLEVPTGQEPGMGLELGTERGQSPPPAVVTVMGSEHLTAAKGPLSIARLFPACAHAEVTGHQSSPIRNTCPWSLLWSQAQTVLVSGLLSEALSSWAQAVVGVSAVRTELTRSGEGFSVSEVKLGFVEETGEALRRTGCP